MFDGRSNLYTRDPLPIGNEKMELEVSGTLFSVVVFEYSLKLPEMSKLKIVW